MNDLISRQAAIGRAVEIPLFGKLVKVVAVSELEALPSVQPEQCWTPCSERLPAEDTEVFVYLFDRPSAYIAWVIDGHWYTEDFEVGKEDAPVAWMPLPKPYLAEKREE